MEVSPPPSQRLLEDIQPKFPEEEESFLGHRPVGGPGVQTPSQDRKVQKREDGTIDVPGLGNIDPNKPQIQQALSTVSVTDFSRLSDVPCFRRAMLTGGAIAFVAFGVLMSTRSPTKRAMNWAVGGFSIGAVGSWEQCRFKVRQEKKQQQMAREMYRRKGNERDE